MSEETIKITESPVSNLIIGDYTFFVNDNGVLKQIDSDIVQEYFTGATWTTLVGKPFTNLNTNEFNVNGSTLQIVGYHIHTNQTNVLDKLTVDSNSKLNFDGTVVGGEYTLPTASTTTLGGVKIDGTTITITDGVISSVNSYTLPIATTSTLGGIKVDGTTITIDENGVISAEGIDFESLQEMLLEGSNINITADTTNNTLTFAVDGHTLSIYTNNTAYVANDIVIYDNNIYQRIANGTDAEWINSNWNCLSSGTAGINAYVWIKYSINQPTADIDMSDTPNAWIGIYSGTSSTAPTTYSSYTWFKFKGETGANGNDGAVPTIDPTTKHWMCGTEDSGIIAEAQSNYFYTGTDFPTSDLIDGDLFLSFATTTKGNVYQYSINNTSWSLQGNLYGGGASIDDTTSSVSSCYSSSKINELLANKSNKTTLSADITLVVADWDSTSKTQTISATVDITRLNTPLPSTTSLEEYSSCGVYLSAETTTGYTFTCKTIPTNALTLKMKSEVIA